MDNRMKVAIFAPYDTGTGYSKIASEMILSLDSVGIDVVPRSVRMTNTDGEVSERIKELEKNSLLDVDVVIQYNLPSEFCYKGGVLNVGAFAYETSGFPNTTWKHSLRMMDLVICPCNYQRSVVIKEIGQDFLNKTAVIPSSYDTDLFDKEYKIFDFGVPKNCTKFYTIAELGRRKNIAGLIAAYYSEFSSDDNVLLVIKTHSSSRDSSAYDSISKIIQELKVGISRFATNDRYPKIALITEYMSDNEIMSIHKSCDVFVTASHGESWCIPASDALGCGNLVIAPKTGAFKDYIIGNNGILVDGQESSAFGVNSIPGLYSADETWFNVNIKELGKTMRSVYINKDSITQETKENIKNYAKEHFSRKVVGNKLKTVLLNHLNEHA